jgi:hypothetical protein
MNWLPTMLQSLSRPMKWWIVVASWEQGLRIRLGRNPTRLDPGIHFRIPFVDRIYVQSTRARVISVENQSLSTKDGKVYTVSLGVRFRINNIITVYETMAQPEGILACDALSLVARYISAKDSKDVDPEELESAINDNMPSYGSGLTDVLVNVTGFCHSRCYRMITGGTWVPTGTSLDGKDNSGEK